MALLLLILLSLPFLISANRFKPMLESKLSAALARQVTIGDLRLSILSGGVTAGGLAIAEDPAFGASPFLQAKSLKVGVELWPLIVSRKLNVTGLTIEQPQVTLLQSPEGRWNYASLGGTPAQAAPPAQEAPEKDALDLTVKQIRIDSGRFSIGKTGGRRKPLALEDVNLEVRDFSPSAAFPFSLDARVAGGGDIKLEGKAGPLDPANAQMTPLSFALEIARLNLASALGEAAPGTAGTASLRANGASSGGRVTVNGKLTAEGLQLSKNGAPSRRPVELDFAAAHDLRRRAGKIERGDIRVGGASASLTGTYAESGEATVLDMKFAGTKMPVPELAELLPPLGIALPKGSKLEGGTASAAFSVAGPTGRLVADGALSVDNTRLANFDLGTKMRLIQSLAGVKSGPDTDIEVLSAKLKHTTQGMAVEGLRLIATGVGELNGSGTVSPANALDFKMSARVQTTRSAALSQTAVPFFVQGTAADPVFKADVRGLLQSEAEKRLKGDAKGLLDKLFGNKK